MPSRTGSGADGNGGAVVGGAGFGGGAAPFWARGACGLPFGGAVEFCDLARIRWKKLVCFFIVQSAVYAMHQSVAWAERSLGMMWAVWACMHAQ